MGGFGGEGLIHEGRHRLYVDRWLLRFGYDGSRFSGWARQPGPRTVEGELLRGLVRLDLAPTDAAGSIPVASRTDRGVSARGNALALHAALTPDALLRALNGIAPDICFTAASPIPESFRVRSSPGRVYRYFDAVPVRSPWRRAAALRALTGRIDVRSFGRGIPPNQPCWRTVDSFTSRRVSGGSQLEIRAPSFVWGMVRKLVAALRAVDSGDLTITDLRLAAEGQLRLTLALAEPDPLVLWDVSYPIPWTVVWRGPNRHQAAYWQRQSAGLWARRHVIESLLPFPATGSRRARSDLGDEFASRTS